MTIYTKKEYCDKYGMSHDTLERRVKYNALPSWQKVKHLDGRGFVIIIDQCEMCNINEKAVREYNRRVIRGGNPEIAAELSVKYGINTAKFFKMVGL